MDTGRMSLYFVWTISLPVMFILGRYNSGLGNISEFSSSYIALSVHAEPPSPPEALDVTFAGNVCTPDILRQYYRSRDYFPTEGKWTEATETAHETFSPNLCKFTDPPKRYMPSDMLKNSMNSFVVLGDDHAKALYQRLVDMMSRVYEKPCVIAKQERILREGYVLDEKFFVGGKNEVLLGRVRGLRRPCNTCLGQQTMCGGGKSDSVTLEYTPLFTMDYRTARSKDHQLEKKTLAWQTSSFLSEFLGRFLPSKNARVIIFCPPFNLLTGEDPEKLKSDIKDIVHVIQTHIQTTTKVVWIPALSAIQKEEATIGQRQQGLSVQQMNRVLFRALKDSLVLKPLQRYGLFDLEDTIRRHPRNDTRSLDMWSENLINMLMPLMLERD